VAKYDVFKPNTDIKTGDIGKPGTNLDAGDIPFYTLGLGWIFHWDANIKIVAYYEFVKNEKIYQGTTNASLKPFTEDLNDDIFTFRIQYKF
jgi:hypothetical protein